MNWDGPRYRALTGASLPQQTDGKIKMTPQQVKTLSIARHLLTLATRELSSRNDVAQCVGIALLQDSLETVLLCLAEQVNAQLKESAGFNLYLDEIDKRIAPASLPFRSKLLRINRLRVNAKHHAIPPPADEIPELLTVTREFEEEVCTKHLAVNFWTISFSNILDEGDVKNALQEAEVQYQGKDFTSVLQACRKVIYLLFERDYDIQSFEPGATPRGPGLRCRPYSKAPFYACNKEYIEKSVREPTDYIVLDHQDLEHRLLISGIDPTSFWNIWRLTPAAYRRADKTWVFRFDLDQLDTREIQSRAEYVFARTEELAIAEFQTRCSQQIVPSSCTFLLLMSGDVKVYEKADATSSVAEITPQINERIRTLYCTSGLKDDEVYWRVYDGFIRDADVKKVERGNSHAG